eukprot:m.3570 g.3570  ORF g.3570 m.3570 type:complete len:135 (+) comp6049_c0_seq1:89-493(+)
MTIQSDNMLTSVFPDDHRSRDVFQYPYSDSSRSPEIESIAIDESKRYVTLQLKTGEVFQFDLRPPGMLGRLFRPSYLPNKSIAFEGRSAKHHLVVEQPPGFAGTQGLALVTIYDVETSSPLASGYILNLLNPSS